MHPSLVMRDATYSAETQERLRTLLRALEQPPAVPPGRAYVAALRDVVERWDANDATEYVPVDLAADEQPWPVPLALVRCRRPVEGGDSYWLPCLLPASHDGPCGHPELA